jgi:hypothetical protein
MYASMEISQTVHADFTKEIRLSFQSLIANWMTRKNNGLLSFEEVYKDLPSQGRHYAGLQAIAIESIVGSVGRCRDFDRNFRPRRSEQSERWMSVDKAYYHETALPPIELYKVGEHYFVMDGHHRVSVARAHDQVFIDAYVTEFDEPCSDEDQNIPAENQPVRQSR